MNIDPFTPWQEDVSGLQDRHVDRDDAERWLRQSIQAFLAGKSPPYPYLGGPRGSGKSHLVRLVLGAAAVTTACAVRQDY